MILELDRKILSLISIWNVVNTSILIKQGKIAKKE